MTPLLPRASRADLEAELAEIRAERVAIDGAVAPERAAELRVSLALWERRILDQLREMDSRSVVDGVDGFSSAVGR